MVDVVQKTKDLIKLALHTGTPENERNDAAVSAVRLIDKYELLANKKRIDVIASEIKKYMSNPDFMGDIANRFEKAVSDYGRIVGTAKKLLGDTPPRSGGRRRRFSGR